MSQSEKSGWIVILIVVSAIGLLAAIIAFKRGAKTGNGFKLACIHNLRMIDGAEQVWAVENKKVPGDKVTDADLLLTHLVGNAGALPVCPQGGTYTLGAIGKIPSAPCQNMYCRERGLNFLSD